MDFWDGFDANLTSALKGLSYCHFGENISESSIFDRDEELEQEFYGYNFIGW